MIFSNIMNRMVKFGVILCILSLFFGTTVLAAEDPYYIKQWYLKTINAEQAWQVTKGSPSIVVAVLDTGVDIDHPDLQDNIWTNPGEIPGDGLDNDKNGYIDDVHGWNFIRNIASPQPKIEQNSFNDSASHGTFLAGLISAIHDNGFGIKGVTANVKIMPLVVLDPDGFGWSDGVADAVNYATANGASIINLSFGGDEHSEKLKNSIINAYNKGVLVVAAAGNTLVGGVDLTSSPIYPICYDQEFTENRVLGVIATDKTNRVTSFTNYGKGCIDLAAPGVDMTSLVYQNSAYPAYHDYVSDGWQGNSFSTALVAGAAALLRSYKPDLKVNELRDLLMSESGLIFLPDPKYNDKAGQGILDIKRAMDKLVSLAGVTSVIPPEQGTVVNQDNNQAVGERQLFVATKAGGKGTIRVYDNDFQFLKEITVFGGDKFHGVNFQLIDINGDGVKEIAAGAVKGDEPFVRVLDLNGNIISSFFPFPDKFRGGVQVTAGDVDGDGAVEIVVAPDSSFAPSVKIYNQNGQLKKEFAAFDKDYKNGLDIAVGDVLSDSKAEIVVAPRKGQAPAVKIFDGAGHLKKTISVFVNSFKGGVNLSLSDLNKDGKLDIVVGKGTGAASEVRAFDSKGTKILALNPYVKAFIGGVMARIIDWNGDGQLDIVTAPGAGGGPHIKVFSGKNMLTQFFPLSNKFTSGINIDIK